MLGLIFTTLAALQSGHNVRGLWRRSFVTSLGLGSCQFFVVQWAAIESALGSSLPAGDLKRQAPGRWDHDS